jgi:site-specific recombinase XerC
MSVEYRKNRKRWGYRFFLRGQCFSRYVWDSKTEAKQAEREAQVDARKNPGLQPTALLTASGAYLIASAERGRSKWRIDGLNYNFKAHIIPHFGEAALITDLTPQMVENFIAALKRKGLKNKTVKNIITDLRALFNWAMEEDINLMTRNPVTKKVAKLIDNTRAVKAPINPRWFDIAAANIENKRDKAWFDVTRYLGMRKDESNRLQWIDVNWNAGKVRIPGTKTDEAEVWLPVAPVALKTLRDLYESKDRDLNSPYVFPGRSAQSKGKKIYSRRRMFERIQQVTAIKKYLRQHPGLSYQQALEATRKEGFKGGIHLAPKDLRDFFCTEIAAKSDDANVAMRLMRHTSLATTTKYMRTVEDRMREAVENLGCDSGCDSMAATGHEMSQLANLEELQKVAKKLINHGFLKGKFGGGEWSRTTDAADMSRVL